MTAINELIKRIKAKEFHDVDDVLDVALVLASEEQTPTDLWGQHKAMIKLAQDHGLTLAANWAVNMSGRTFGEQTKPSESELVRELWVWGNNCVTQTDEETYERCPGMQKFDEILSKHTYKEGNI